MPMKRRTGSTGAVEGSSLHISYDLCIGGMEHVSRVFNTPSGAEEQVPTHTSQIPKARILQRGGSVKRHGHLYSQGQYYGLNIIMYYVGFLSRFL